MQGKTLIMKAIGNKFWDEDIRWKNSKGKKHAWPRAEAKQAARKLRKQNKSKNNDGE